MEDYKTINKELSLYAKDLSTRPQIVVANKCEMPDTQENVKRLQEQVAKDVKDAKDTDKQGLLNEKVFVISAVTGMGVRELNLAVANKVAEIKAARDDEEVESEAYDKVWTLDKRPADEFEIKQIAAGIFEVVGKKPVRAVVQTDLDNEDAVVFLQHRLKRMGVERALAEAGAIDGDEIQIAGRNFEFENTEANTSQDIYGDLD